MQFPQRSETTDCAFYMKTGECKFGSACKFNHPPKRRKPRVRAKKGSENVQQSLDCKLRCSSLCVGSYQPLEVAREEHESNGSKMMVQGARRLPNNAVGKQKECLYKKVEQTERKDDKVEKQTSSRRLQQEDCKFQKKAIGKQIPPFKKFVQIEKKADEAEKHCSMSEQEDNKTDEVEKNCSMSEKEDSKIPKNFIGKQIPPFKKFVQIEEKTDEVEKHCSMSELEDSKLQKNAIRKQIPPFKKFEQTEKKIDEAEKQCSMLEQEDSKFQKNAIEKQIPPLKKYEQTEKKADKVEKQSSRSEQEDSKFQKKAIGKQIPPFKKFEQSEKKVNYAVHKAGKVEKHSSRWEQEDSKASEKMSKEAISGNIGTPECKLYKTSCRRKHGKSCKYTHSLKKIEVVPLELNFLGLPIRPGEKECPCYMGTGNCKYAVNCKYHHPEPTVATVEQGALPVCQIGGAEQQIPFGALPVPVTPGPQGAFNVPTPSMVASPAYFPESHLHTQGLWFPSNSECNGYQR